MQLSERTMNLLLQYQKDELTDHYIYSKFVGRVKDGEDKEILRKIAADELKHSNMWKRYTKQEVQPNRLSIWWYTVVSIIMGYTFVIKLMEKGEYKTTDAYKQLIGEVPEAERIIQDEQRHEAELNEMLDEERLQYVGAMVLGLNDALVELTGALAGFSLAYQSTSLVALSGIITGVSATFSMAASNYLAERADGNDNAMKSSMYTGVAYLVTVVLLVLPYLLFPEQSYIAALATMLVIVILIIFFFNYYIAVAKSQDFKRRFLEMAGISMGVAVISFLIGVVAKNILGIDV